MSVSRKIPTVMFSQHPDHASTPYWHKQPFIKTHHELEECYRMFSDLGAEEMMWDWEGKLVDEAVVERLLGTYYEFFSEHPLGRDLFLTFRVPNPRIESGYRLGRAFMIVLSSHQFAHTAGLSHSPLFEVILPMTESSDEMLSLQKSFRRISRAATHSFGSNGFSTDRIEVIPIFETVETILQSGEILNEYIKATTKHQQQLLPYVRPFCARSDPALNSGIVPTTLAIKWALSAYAKLQEASGIPLYPITAPGALPFRGGLTPHTVEEFLSEFAGIKTVVIQSAFRYDFPQEQVKAAIQTINRIIPTQQATRIESTMLAKIKKTITMFETPYKTTVEMIAPRIKEIAPYIPKRRERVQHIGLFGYSRQVGNVKLPRAIGFTASCYSIGIPPELFGTGQGIKAAKKAGTLKLVEELYSTLKPSLIRAGRYLRKESIKELGCEEIAEDIQIIEEYLGQELTPQTAEELQHAEHVKSIIRLVKKGENPHQDIEQAALLRHSLG